MKTRFGDFLVDTDTRQLLRGGAELHLPRKAFDLLCLLVANRPKVLDKNELYAKLWPNSYVDEAGLNVLIGDIRRALGDDAKQPRFIRTVHRVGYAFCGDATEAAEPASNAPATTWWLVCGDTRYPLTDGENIVGRDPRCTIWLDAPGVSRRHASLKIDRLNGTVTVADLGSTNGTFVRRRPIDGDVVLQDGDELTIGSMALKLRVWSPEKEKGTRRIPRRR